VRTVLLLVEDEKSGKNIFNLVKYVLCKFLLTGVNASSLFVFLANKIC
jgi:hypothetical protein